MIYDVLYLDTYGEADGWRCLEGMALGQREAIEGLRHGRRRREKTAAYDLLTRLLKGHGLWHEAPEIAYAPGGKPYLANYPELHFNLSHCDKAVTVAIDERGAIGIDIECRRAVGEGVMRRVCNEAEIQSIMMADDPVLAFVRLWTRKEALLKQRGTGITVDPRAVLDAEQLAHEGVVIESHALERIEGFVSVCYKG